jgi:hypothetical protein
MWFFLVRSPIPMRVDSGDSADIIHKRILKGTRRAEPGRRDSPQCVSEEIGFIYMESSRILCAELPSGPDHGDLQMKYSSVSI